MSNSEQLEQTERMAPDQLAHYGLLFGLAMMTIGVVWAGLLRGQDMGAAWFPAQAWGRDLALGAALGLGFALAAWKLLDVVPALRRIERLLAETLDIDALGYHHAVIFGLVAGIPEEILFRGAMQPVLGWPLTALIFGALHGITRAYFVYATVAGLLLGGLVLWRDGLWAAMAAHTVIDMVMFALLIRKWRKQPGTAHHLHIEP